MGHLKSWHPFRNNSHTRQLRTLASILCMRKEKSYLACGSPHLEFDLWWNQLRIKRKLNLLIHENESCSAGLLKETVRFEDENDYDYT